MNFNKMRAVYTAHAPDKYAIYENAMEKTREPAGKPYILRPAIAAALVLFALLGGYSGYAIATEIREYRTAAAFFEEYELPTDGLTRPDIKAVYKDITMKTYSYEKTIELLNTLSVEVFSTRLNSADKNELDSLWNARNSVLTGNQNGVNSPGVRFTLESVSEKGDANGPYYTVITRYSGDTELWDYRVPYDMYVSEEDVFACGDNTAIIGAENDTESGTGNAVVFMLGPDGSELWRYVSDIKCEGYDFAVYSGDRLAVFGTRYADGGSGRQWYLTYTEFNASGRKIIYRENTLNGYCRVLAVVRIGDYYLAKTWTDTDSGGYGTGLVSISENGEIVQKFSYSSDGKTYQIQDIAAFGGRVYLSAVIPNTSEEDFEKEFNGLLETYHKALVQSTGRVETVTMPDEYNEKLRNLFIDRYDAALLVCGEDAEVTKVYSVGKARGGSLAVTDDGRLRWSVIRIDDVKNSSIFVSSYRVDIAATEFVFVFNSKGILAEKKEIGPYSLKY